MTPSEAVSSGSAAEVASGEVVQPRIRPALQTSAELNVKFFPWRQKTPATSEPSRESILAMLFQTVSYFCTPCQREMVLLGPLAKSCAIESVANEGWAWADRRQADGESRPHDSKHNMTTTANQASPKIARLGMVVWLAGAERLSK